MVQGYLDYAKYGLVLASAVTEAIKAYRKEQDVLGRFFEEECEFKPKDFVDSRVSPRYSAERGSVHRGFILVREKQVRVVLNNKLFKAEIGNRFQDRIQERQVTVENKKQEWRWVGVTTENSSMDGGAGGSSTEKNVSRK